MKINNTTVRWIGQSVSKSLGMIVFFFGTVRPLTEIKGNYTEALAYCKDAQQLETSNPAIRNEKSISLVDAETAMIKLSEKLQIPVLQIGSRVIPNSNVSKFPMRVERPLRAKIKILASA